MMKNFAEYEAKKTDADSWRIGLYVGMAIGSAFGGSDYPELPYSYEEIEDNEDDKEDEIASVKFAEWANVFNKKLNGDSNGQRADR